MNNKKIRIERTTTKGYESNEYEMAEALKIINLEVENKRTIWIDGRPFFGQFVSATDIEKCKKEISITNRLIGG